MPIDRKPAAAATVTSSGGVVSSTVRWAREVGCEVMLGSAHNYHASGARVPSSAPERRRSRRGDRLLRPAVSDLEGVVLGRPARARVSQRRPRPLHEGRCTATDVAADRHLALRLARHRHAREPGDVPGPPRRRAVALYTTDEGGFVLVSSDSWPGTGGVPGR